MPYIWLAALTSKHSLYIVQLESQMGGGCQISGWLHYLADSIFVGGGQEEKWVCWHRRQEGSGGQQKEDTQAKKLGKLVYV